jgi:hypothetical protein
MTSARGLTWPLILIMIGAFFLLVNFGVIPAISGFALFALWPLILVIIGVDLAIGRRWPLAALGINVVAVAIGVGLVAQGAIGPAYLPHFHFGNGSDAPGVSSVDVPRQDGVTRMSLRVSGGAGTFEVKGGAQSLVHAESTLENLRLRSSNRSGDRLDVRIDQSGTRGFTFGPSGAPQMTMTVASDVPTSLTVDAGAGEFVIDLRDVSVSDARISVGAASLRLVLPRPTGDIDVNVSAGASSVVIEVPSGVEARITTTGGLSSTRSENSRFTGSETPGYAAAKDRVTVRISAGASSVRIV